MPRSTHLARAVVALLPLAWTALLAGAPTDQAGDEPLPPGAVARFGSVRLRHEGRICAVAFLPDGQSLIAVGDGDGDVRLWDAASGRELRQFPATGKQRAFFRGALSPDGKTLATDSAEGVTLWEVASGKPLRVLPAKTKVDHVRGLAFSPDGKKLAAAGREHVIRIWETDTGKELSELKGHANPVSALAFAANGKLLASGHGLKSRGDRVTDFTIHIWNVESGQVQSRCQGHQDDIGSLAFTLDSRVLVSGSGDLSVRLWEASSGKELKHFAADKGRVRQAGLHASVAVAPDGKTLALADGLSVRLVDWTTDTELRRLASRGQAAGGTQVLAFSADGKTLAAGGARTIHLWETASGRELFAAPRHLGAVVVAAVSPAGLVASADNEGRIQLWDTAGGKLVRGLSKEGYAFDGLGFSPDGKLLAARGGVYANGSAIAKQARLVIFDVASGKELVAFGRQKPANNPKVGGLYESMPPRFAFAPDGRHLAVDDLADFTLRLCRADNGEEVRRFTKTTASYFFEFTGGGRGLLGVAKQGNASIIQHWDVASGAALYSTIVPDIVEVLALSPDGRFLLGHTVPKPQVKPGDKTRHLCLYEVLSGQEVVRYAGKAPARWHARSSVGFAADGSLLALASLKDFDPGKSSPAYMASCDQQLQLFDAFAGQEVLTFQNRQRDPRWISAVRFAPGGHAWLASGGDLGSITVWDAGAIPARKRPAARLTDQQLEQSWTELAHADARRAVQAAHALAADAEQAPPFLHDRLRAVLLDEQRLARLLAQLDDDDFAVREQASAELERLGELIVPVLQRALAGKPPLEVQRRLERLLAKLEPKQKQPLTPEQLRGLRAVGVLESIGTPAARQALDKLAKGSGTARLTREAQAALERLGK